MTPTDQQRSDIDRAAADWVARLRSPDAAEAEWLDFDAWIEAGPAHAAAYDRALALWTELGRMAPGLRAAAAPVAFSPRRGQSRRLVGWGLGAAAAAAVVAAVLPMMMSSAQTYTTGRGETRSVTLADGSTIHMNAQSTLSVRMTRNARRVAMNDAEAVFDVAKDAERPFLITAGDRTVRVVGTEFDVAHRADDLAVTVRRGVVQVRPNAATDEGAVNLTRGQRLEHRAGGGVRVSAADPEEVFAWRGGKLVYRQRPLAEVVAELNRHFDQDIALADAEAGRQPFSGVLVLDNQKAVVERLSLLTPVTITRSDAGFVLRSNAPSRR